ncbi:MAG TPA: hypothetical protein PL033_12125 [Candidatus Brocadiia bacterium]|nr:hypothetical protein [Candidatus Brocadiia bacterium]
MLVISCHADTGFMTHRLAREADGTVFGHLDNFSGVYSVMQAYFSGRMDRENVRIELTYGEEVDFAGAQEVLETLSPHDFVIVVDVTGTPTGKGLVIEKCADPLMREFATVALRGMEYDLYEGCPDPIANQDEVDVYRDKCRAVCFLGLPCAGGDYNAGRVRCREESLKAVTEALCRMVERFHDFCAEKGIRED